jgi:hypothetical protein
MARVAELLALMLEMTPPKRWLLVFPVTIVAPRNTIFFIVILATVTL